MKLNKEARKVCRELFRSSFTDGKLDGSKAGAIVRSVAEKKPRHYIDILKEYQRLIRLETAKTHAVIESAAQLNPDTGRKVANDLRAKYGADLTTEFKVTPELIGGLRIKIGSDVWDGSVRHRLDRLQQEFSQV
jgi:F-type H+-transporting ATPase subunit delta